MDQTQAEWIHDAQVMQEFLSTAYWQVLKKHIEAMLEDKTNRVLHSEMDTRYWQGVYFGTKDVLLLPKSIVEETESRGRYARS